MPFHVAIDEEKAYANMSHEIILQETEKGVSDIGCCPIEILDVKLTIHDII